MSIVTVKQLQINISVFVERGANKLLDTAAGNSHAAIGGDRRFAVCLCESDL